MRNEKEEALTSSFWLTIRQFTSSNEKPRQLPSNVGTYRFRSYLLNSPYCDSSSDLHSSFNLYSNRYSSYNNGSCSHFNCGFKILTILIHLTKTRILPVFEFFTFTPLSIERLFTIQKLKLKHFSLTFILVNCIHIFWFRNSIFI